MRKFIKISLWIGGGIIALPILIISIILVVHICTTVFGTKDNLSYKEVLSKHPNAEMIFYIGEPKLTHLKDCVMEYVVIENTSAIIKIKDKKEYESSIINVANDDEGSMFLLDNDETFSISRNPFRFTFIKNGAGNSYTIDKIYTKSSD